MKADYPTREQTEGLCKLWQEAFGDNDAFLDAFWSTAFSSDRCRCITVDGEVAAALYWFDCRCENKPMAYLYAVATARSHRGKGLCKALMESTHTHWYSFNAWALVVLLVLKRVKNIAQRFAVCTLQNTRCS